MEEKLKQCTLDMINYWYKECSLPLGIVEVAFTPPMFQYVTFLQVKIG
jgi:hypothetical protein